MWFKTPWPKTPWPKTPWPKTPWPKTPLAEAPIHAQTAPIEPGSHARAAVAPPAGEPSAQSALDEFLCGEPPDNASIGLYTDAPRAAAANAAKTADAAQSQAGVLLDQQSLAQDVALDDLAPARLAANQEARQTQADAIQRDRGAVTGIARSLEHALAQTPHADMVAKLQDLLQSVGNGASDEIGASTARLQSALALAGALSLAPMLDFALAPAAGERAAMRAPSQISPAVAASDALASAARALQGELEAALPADWLTALAYAIPAATHALPQVDPYANPLLLAFQFGVLVGVKTTLNKPGPLREDRMVILPILGLGECELHEDGRADE